MQRDSLHTQHERLFEANRFVYPVLSRRSGGVSVGVNLNPDKICNFDCIYCQVDRRDASETKFVETDRLLEELQSTLQIIDSGQLYEHPKFSGVPVQLRRLNDIAFSGDGEPTTYRNFPQLMELAANVKADAAGADVKMVLITNASMFHRPHVREGLSILDANQGEIWAKLDAGTEDYYQLVERTPIPFQQILDNITEAAQTRPLVIQAMFMKIHGEPPTMSERQAFCQRLTEIVQRGGDISLVQLYTVARRPAESFVTPLDDSDLDAFVELVQQVTNLAVHPYYGSTVSAHE